MAKMISDLAMDGKKETKVAKGHLAAILKRYSILKRETDALEAEIKAEVAGMEETVELPDVAVVKYSKPARKFDYEAVCSNYDIPKSVIKKFTESKVLWRDLSIEIGATKEEIEATAVVSGNPTVSIKLLGE